MLRRIVAHPAVADTAHIDRATGRIEIDAPGIPSWLRLLLATDRVPPLAGGLALAGAVGLWMSRTLIRRIACGIDRLPGVGLGVSLACLAAGYAVFFDNGPGVDENVHYDQIARFTRGDWSMNPALTMPPGFHALVAAALAISDPSERAARAVVFVIAVASVVVFYLCAVARRCERPGLRTLQFTLLPVLFHQFFLIYTDVASLLCVLLMVWATMRRKTWLAGWLGLVACLMRQDNIVWVAWAMAWSYLDTWGATWQPVTDVAKRYWTFAVTGMLFVGFIAANEGQVALGNDAGSHPTGVLRLTNTFLLLGLSAVWFAPIWLAQPRRLRTVLAGWRTWGAVAAAVVLFWFGFVNDHPHNNERADYFLPNALLMAVAAGGVVKVVFAGLVGVMVLALRAMPLRGAWWTLLPFSVLFLLPEWLVAPRYYLIPLALYTVAREEAPLPAEYATTVLLAVLSATVVVVMERGIGWV